MIANELYVADILHTLGLLGAIPLLFVGSHWQRVHRGLTFQNNRPIFCDEFSSSGLYTRRHTDRQADEHDEIDALSRRDIYFCVLQTGIEIEYISAPGVQSVKKRILEFKYEKDAQS